MDSFEQAEHALLDAYMGALVELQSAWEADEAFWQMGDPDGDEAFCEHEWVFAGHLDPKDEESPSMYHCVECGWDDER